MKLFELTRPFICDYICIFVKYSIKKLYSSLPSRMKAIIKCNMLSSPPYGALCAKYRALIAEMQKRKRPILCYSEFRAKALVRQTITDN